MLHFIIDGYNLINRIPHISKKPLALQREYLINLISGFKFTMSRRNKVTVVFDGKEDVYSCPLVQKPVKVIFSKGLDADSLIKDMVGRERCAGQLIVITDDKGLIAGIRGRGAQHKSTEDFLKDIYRKQADIEPDNFKIGTKQMRQINQEIKDIWSKKY